MTDNFSSTRSQKKKRKQEFAKDEDEDVIVRPPGGRTLGQKCGNPQCYVRASEVTLKACAKCKTVRYVKLINNDLYFTALISDIARGNARS